MKIVFDPDCLKYKQPGHPESPRRVALAWEFLSTKYDTVPPVRVAEEEVLRVHTQDHLDAVRNGWYVDFDTPALPGMFDHAMLAAGGALTAMRLTLESSTRQDWAFSLMRPPGHHAGPAYVAGFCYLNNVAIATAAALEHVDRVAIVDIDCHHGNGTEDIFRHNERVMFLSLHQSPFYPGTGLWSEGNCINYPMGEGTDDTAWLAALEQGIEKIAAFRPDLIGVSAGFDAYKNDRFSIFMLSLDTYRAAGEKIASLGRPVFSVLEGGYSDEVGACAEAYIAGLESVT